MKKERKAAAGARISKAEATAKALELKKAGISYRTIADRLGLAPSTVHKYIKEALARLTKENQEIAKSFQSLQLARYEEILRPTYQKAIGGDLKAVETTRRILDSINRLTGAEAPAKIAPTTPDGKQQYNPDNMTPEERKARIKELMEKLGK